MDTINRRPVVDAHDMHDGVYYVRREGQRPLLYITPGYHNEEKIMRTLVAYNQRHFIDYVVCFQQTVDPRRNASYAVRMCNAVHIPVMFFEADNDSDTYKDIFMHAVANAMPTCILVFDSINDIGNRHYIFEANLPVEIVAG